MTEITDKTERYLVPRFLGALIVGPVLGAVLSYLVALPVSFTMGMFEVDPSQWIFILAPSMGLMFGLPFYLTVGAMGFIITIGLGRTRVMDFARAAFLANLASPLISLLFHRDGDYALMLLFFGAFAAPVWGAGFGIVYRWTGGLGE